MHLYTFHTNEWALNVDFLAKTNAFELVACIVLCRLPSQLAGTKVSANLSHVLPCAELFEVLACRIVVKNARK